MATGKQQKSGSRWKDTLGDRIGRTACKFYILGKCKAGPECTWRHDGLQESLPATPPFPVQETKAVEDDHAWEPQDQKTWRQRKYGTKPKQGAKQETLPVYLHDQLFPEDEQDQMPTAYGLSTPSAAPPADEVTETSVVPASAEPSSGISLHRCATETFLQRAVQRQDARRVLREEQQAALDAGSWFPWSEEQEVEFQYECQAFLEELDRAEDGGDEEDDVYVTDDEYEDHYGQEIEYEELLVNELQNEVEGLRRKREEDESTMATALEAFETTHAEQSARFLATEVWNHCKWKVVAKLQSAMAETSDAGTQTDKVRYTPAEDTKRDLDNFVQELEEIAFGDTLAAQRPCKTLEGHVSHNMAPPWRHLTDPAEDGRSSAVKTPSPRDCPSSASKDAITCRFFRKKGWCQYGKGCRLPHQGESHEQDVSTLHKVREGDWVCRQCSDVQFAKNTACRKCGTPRIVVPSTPPLQQVMPSEVEPAQEAQRYSLHTSKTSGFQYMWVQGSDPVYVVDAVMAKVTCSYDMGGLPAGVEQSEMVKFRAACQSRPAPDLTGWPESIRSLWATATSAAAEAPVTPKAGTGKTRARARSRSPVRKEPQQVEKMTISQLKLQLKDRELPRTGTKPVLLQRLQEALEFEAEQAEQASQEERLDAGAVDGIHAAMKAAGIEPSMQATFLASIKEGDWKGFTSGQLQYAYETLTDQ